MTPRTHYQLLQVDPAASQEVIDAAYRSLARRYHPDVSSHPDAGRIMQEINDAYAVLKDTEKRRAYDRSIGQATAQQSQATSRTSAAQSSPPAPPPPSVPVRCQKCGRSDSTLRITRFRQVLSFVLWTTRREWGGLYCLDCRRAEMGRAKLVSFLLGWWGIPFGIFYTLGVLFESGEGEIPVDPNADYLPALGLYFLNRGERLQALQAFQASLALRYDSKLEAAIKEIFGDIYVGSEVGRRHDAARADSVRHDSVSVGEGWKWVLYAVLAITGLAVLVSLPLGLAPISTSPSATPVIIEPTELPTTATSSSFPPVTINSVWQRQVESEDGFWMDIPSGLTRSRRVSEDGGVVLWYAGAVGQDFHGLSVSPLYDIGMLSSPSDSENALQSIDSWLTEMQGATVVLHPRVETVYSHTVIRFSFDQLLESGGSVRIHGCQIPANDRSYLLQVAGNAAIDQDLQDILGRVVRSFRVMEE